MKRFMVFGYDDYYPSGGMHDFIKDFDTLDEALAYIKKPYTSYQNFDVYDLQLRMQVY